MQYHGICQRIPLFTERHLYHSIGITVSEMIMILRSMNWETGLPQSHWWVKNLEVAPHNNRKIKSNAESSVLGHRGFPNDDEDDDSDNDDDD